ncbi:hypothetical protein DMC30DRAFT_407141 [Rhodotorula diobovata]|uniref:Uncharacterized protein n=1 Tax=Rhodotorula diobovata TaxID=5288 RepID=A0A5C5FJT4_9BASI|nr:hypothetical protein DMC30DRAFT_407141 [Rhodotorula diobovata]
MLGQAAIQLHPAMLAALPPNALASAPGPLHHLLISCSPPRFPHYQERRRSSLTRLVAAAPRTPLARCPAPSTLLKHTLSCPWPGMPSLGSLIMAAQQG